MDYPPASNVADYRAWSILSFESDDVVGRRHIATRNTGRIVKVVRFGSCARGDWEEWASGYRSDYDLLVVINHEERTDVVEYWAGGDEHLLREHETTKTLSAPVNFIVHSPADVNRHLGTGRPFYVDIVRDRVLLYQSQDEPFSKPCWLSPEEAR
ncbi:nucleotidyltransferase domain-containing protein [Phenylobacterium sp. J426]|uniref:nucleotidyltransferase domain-containing protein n=1 Tax=Phenylobacterium sp. J426 TaxID=2898439 RepID=UPI00215077A9|nr:nucleotidyltransferase domain-containing protein [Phenylobacterium sp. J426]MCR5876213.1 nucleotidyltransferase domain-containing protein [Phenylobacterium sp. J426]